MSIQSLTVKKSRLNSLNFSIDQSALKVGNIVCGRANHLTNKPGIIISVIITSKRKKFVVIFNNGDEEVVYSKYLYFLDVTIEIEEGNSICRADSIKYLSNTLMK